MQLDTLTIAVASIIIAFVALIFSGLLAYAAIKQAKATSESLHRMSLRSLFTTFNQASQICVDNTNVFYAVGGLDKSVPPQEAKNIAYFGLLMDGFQQFYGQIYNEDFSKMLRQSKEKSTYLNNILAIEENQKRWERIRLLYYGSFDESFVKTIDKLIQYIKSKKQ